MLAAGALSSVMTGSGSAVFGLFSSRAQAERCAAMLRVKGFFAEICDTTNCSFIEI